MSQPAAPTAEDFGDVAWGTVPVSETLTRERALSGSLGGFSATSDLARCLLPLLSALNAGATPREVAESLPHFADDLDLTDFLNVMANLGYESRSLRLSLHELDPRLTPVLFLPEDGNAMVVTERTGDTVKAFDPAVRDFVTLPALRMKGHVHVFTKSTQREGERSSGGYFASILRRFRPLIFRALGATLAGNVIILVTPLFIMNVYDKVIPTGALDTLAMMLVGVAVALAGDYALKILRGRMVAHLGGRLDYILGRAVFQRVLSLPAAFTEMANISSQVARLKDFETVREFFTGPIVTVLFELPFAFVFLILLAILGGPLVVVPLGSMVLFILVAFLVRPHMRRLVSEAARAGSRRHEFLVEVFTKFRDIKDTGTEEVWTQRFQDLSAEAALKGHAAARLGAVMGVVSQSLIVLTGLTTLGWGVLGTLDGSISVGGLIAAMIIVWWVLKPLGVVFSALTQVERVRDSVAQIDRLMQVPTERQEGAASVPPKRFKGKVGLSQVSIRYLADQDPALAGVNLEVQPGEIVALVGPNGSGKTTILKLLLGMYRPQAGTVRIDDVDIRQIDPLALRHGIAYVPQQCELFFGTIAQNLRLAHPTATDQELAWACGEAGLLDEIRELPRGFETRIGDGRTGSLPSHFLQRISLARAYLKRAPITLFDEPASGLDFVGDQQFMKVLERMRGHSTVLLVTHRPSHLRLADKVVVMVQGQVRMAGKPDEVLSRLPPGMF